MWGEQSGFRGGRGQENELVLKEIINRMEKQGKELYQIFRDIEKAFDTVDRSKLMKLLKHIGIGSKVIKVMNELYNFTSGDIGMD